MRIKERVALLRERMSREGLSAYLITGADPHQSEIPPRRWASREWISGFSGSAGTVVITHDEAGLWTDFRYYIQAEQELQGSGFTLFREGTENIPSPAVRLSNTLPKGAVVGTCGMEIAASSFSETEKKLNRAGIMLKATNDLLEGIWTDRPPLPMNPVREVPVSLCGERRGVKLQKTWEFMERARADHLLISSLDDIAWILNLRGRDVPFNPLFVSFFLFGPEKATLFIEQDKIRKDLKSELEPIITIAPYGDLERNFEHYIPQGSQLLLNPEKTAAALFKKAQQRAELILSPDCTAEMKSQKNETELEGMRKTHRTDAAAVIKFLHWFEKFGVSDEQEAADKLHQFRSEADEFLEESFATISAFGSNGALCHYSVNPEKPAPVTRRGLLVLDSGGQYLGGTTDITRTLTAGEPSGQERREYTLVLKGHLAVVRQQFPAGTRGYQIDTLARKALWDHGLDYGHGTGHGIGFMLNVHEGPQSISTKPIDVPLKPGMIVSNEPGLYREGLYGMRIENLLVVREIKQGDFGMFLGFEDLTLVPYERKLIDISLLDSVEISQIDEYHKRVFKETASLLDAEIRDWLDEKVRPLS